MHRAKDNLREFKAPFKKPHDRIEWAGWTPPRHGIFPEFRLGGRWWSVAWLALPAFLLGIVMLVGSTWILDSDFGRNFIRHYPGTVHVTVTQYHGFPWWLRLSHVLNLALMLVIIRSGIQILADHPRLYWNRHSTPGTEWFRFQNDVPMDRVWTAKDDAVTLPGWLGIPGGRHTIGIARWIHFSTDYFWFLNGIAFVVLLFFTDQWQRLVPRSWDIVPNAISTALQYSALRMPLEDGWARYNALQQLAYFTTVFIAAPAAVLAGLAQSPALGNRFAPVTKYFNRQVARSVHFLILLYFLFFIAVHVAMVFVTGFKKNFNHIVLNSPADSWTGFLIGIAVLAALGVVWAVLSPLVAGHARSVQRGGAAVIGWVKALMEWWDPRVTFTEKDISPFFWPNGTMPASEQYRRMKAEGFRDFKLRVYGLCQAPQEIAYSDLKALKKQEQVTMHYCIQGWSGVAKWGGVPMRTILEMAKPNPEAKYVVFYSFAEGSEGGIYYDVHKMENMKHELSILAYEMNGEALNELHGLPLRLRCENELGFKNVKWVRAIEFVADFRHLGAGQGGYNEDVEFYGYRMPI